MLETYYAPAARKNQVELQLEIDIITKNPLVDKVLNSLGTVLVLLNEQRQIVAVNDFFLKELGVENPQEVLGLRLGETLGCVHASEMQAGCGTSRSCGTCGAVISMMVSLTENKSSERTCALKAEISGSLRELLLLVRTSPLEIENTRFLVVTVRDVTREQIRANLERVFYHDINNILSSLLLPSEILSQEEPRRWEVTQIQQATERLQKEIALQRDLSLTGGNGFDPDIQNVSVKDINLDVLMLIRGHKSTQDRFVDFAHDHDDAVINTDKMLASRILFNMIINALEASPQGGRVKVGVSFHEGHVCWDVWNEGYIPDSVQTRIFQKYFTTKDGQGRGLGTYSMKMLGETYLNGSIRFTSSEVGGTVFSFVLPIT